MLITTANESAVWARIGCIGGSLGESLEQVEVAALISNSIFPCVPRLRSVGGDQRRPNLCLPSPRRKRRSRRHRHPASRMLTSAAATTPMQLEYVTA